MKRKPSDSSLSSISMAQSEYMHHKIDEQLIQEKAFNAVKLFMENMMPTPNPDLPRQDDRSNKSSFKTNTSNLR